MNNKAKDRYENKLYRFLKECDRLWKERSGKTPEYCHTLDIYNKIVDEVQKKLGLSQDDVQRAWALKRHHSDRHFWHDTEFYKGEQKQNLIKKAERKLKPSDDALEAALKAEDELILDIYDW